MATNAKPGEMISTIISHWLDTMSYLTAPNNLPMIEIVSHCSTKGVSIQSIKGKVANANYNSLEEFVTDFAMLIDFEREELNENLNPDIKTATEGLKSLSEDSKTQIFRVYGIFILEQYLEDWKGKTLDRVNAKTTTIEELYVMLDRKRIRSALLKPKTKTSKFPEEYPKRISKRISAAQKNPEKEKDYLFRDKIEYSNPRQKETDIPPEPCCSYRTSEERDESWEEELNIPSVGMEIQGANRNSPSSELLNKIPMETLDIGNEEFPSSNDEQESLDERLGSVETFGFQDENLKTNPEKEPVTKIHSQTPEFGRYENTINLYKSELIQSTTDKFQPHPSNQSTTLRNALSYHTEDPLDTNDEISSITFDGGNISDEKSDKQNPPTIKIQRPPIIAKRKRKAFFQASKRWRREKRLASKRDMRGKNVKFKTAELNVNANNNNNNTNDVINLNRDEENISATSNIDDDCLITDVKKNDLINVIEVPSSTFTPIKPITLPPNDPKPIKPKSSPIIFDLSPMKPTPHRVPPSTYPIASRPLHGSFYFTPRVSGIQFFPRYPYTTYPPTQPAPLQRFYCRQRIPSFSTIGRHFPPQIRYPHNPAFKSKMFN